MTAPATTPDTPKPLSAGNGAALVTLVEGPTFCLSNTHGDILAGTSHGLFVRNTRVLSRWELRLDGQTPESLSAQTPEAFAAQFVLRRAPRAGFADSSLLLVRERLIAEGLRETITLENLSHESTVVTLELHADADFADLFAVKEGRAPLHGAEPTVFGADLVLSDVTDPARGLSVIASGDPTVIPGVFSWQIVLPAHQRWQTEIIAQPTPAHEPRPARRRVTVETGGPTRRLQAWRDTATDVTADDPLLAQVLRRTESDLGALLIRDEDAGARPFVAAGAPWFMTLFGRDSLLTAWMALPLDVGLSIGTLQRLARLQGRRIDPMTEEQPGRILHELRRGPGSGDVLDGVPCYGSVDATPLFVMLLAESWRWGADEASVRALLPAADAALAWADEYGDRDGDCFIEYQRATTCGPIHQGWKDSFDAINDAEGRLAEPPIALCEVQGYLYAALLGRAELAEAFGDPAAATRLRDRADTLRGKFLEAFWLPEKGWYAIALDGSKRRVDALTSNIAHCLWTGIATDEHAAEIVERLSGERDGFRVRVAHPGHDDGCLQSDELSQRFGLAARHGHRGGRPAAIPACARRRAARRAARERSARCRGRVRWAAARIVLRLSPISVQPAGVLSHGVLPTGMGERCAPAARAIVPGIDPTCAPASADRDPEPAAALGQAGACRTATRSGNRADRGRRDSSDRPWGAARLATRHAITCCSTYLSGHGDK